MKTLFASHRRFSIWRYLISHGQLLLRSVPTGVECSRVEVLFRNVVAIKITMQLDNLTIRQPSEEELLTIGQQVGTPVSQLGGAVFVIKTLKSTGYVVASEFAAAEDDGDYKTPSSLLIEGSSEWPESLGPV